MLNFDALSGNPATDLELDTTITDLQGNDAGIVKKIVDDPKQTGSSLDWGFLFNGPDFLPGPGDATFQVKILSPTPAIPLVTYQNKTGDYGQAHFTRITGFGSIDSAWGGVDEPGSVNTPDGASLSLLYGGLLPLLGLGVRRRIRRT